MAATIRTTHTGSLPRPDDLISTMWANEDGEAVDPADLAEQIAAAVHSVVDRQVEAGITVVNDGEMSKPRYATYVKDRLAGFDGDSIQDYHFADLVDYPRSAELVGQNPGRRKRSAPACTGPISVKDPQAAITDMENLVWKAKPRTVLFEAANPRHAHEWQAFETISVPDDKILCPA